MSNSDLDNASLIFVDGAAIDADNVQIFLGASFRAIKNDRGRALVAFMDGQWTSFDMPEKFVAVTAVPDKLEFMALSKTGSVTIANMESIKSERVPDAGTGGDKYGYVKKIKAIGGTLYVCGDLHQVYKRSDGGWFHIDAGIRVEDRLSVGYCLNDIDGMNESEIYAVGERGLVFFYNGSRWSQVDSPTDVSLERVVCVSEDEIYIAGNHGTILHGNHKTLHTIVDAVGQRFWGLASFRNTVYVCSTEKVYKLVDGVLEEVPLTVPRGGPLHRLSASKTHLWAIGTNNVYRYDGSIWQELIYPYNK